MIENYVFDVEDYTGYSQLKEMTDTCHRELKNIDWNNLIEKLKEAKKDSWVSWHYGTGNSTEMIDFIDGVTDGVINPLTAGVGSWLFLVLVPTNTDCNVNSVIRETFPETVKAVNNLPGVFHAHLNCITPHFRIPSHIDDPEGRIRSIIVTFNISKNCPELVTLDVLGNKHNFKDVEYFVFKSQLEHFADNLSDDNWVLMSIQIKNEYFKK